MSKGQSPFDTSFASASSVLINVTAETTENAEELVTFIKGSAGNGKKLFVDSNFSYNPSTQTLSANNFICDTLVFNDDGAAFPIPMEMKVQNGVVVFTAQPTYSPYDAGNVRIGGLGTLIISGGSNFFGFEDRSTGEYFL